MGDGGRDEQALLAVFPPDEVGRHRRDRHLRQPGAGGLGARDKSGPLPLALRSTAIISVVNAGIQRTGESVMEIGTLTRWGSPKTGREKESLEHYRKSVAYGGRLVKEGKLSYFEPFLFTSGDNEIESGFFIAKGPVAEFFGIIDSEEYRSLLARATLLNEHVRVDMLAVGEGVDRQIADFEKALSALPV